MMKKILIFLFIMVANAILFSQTAYKMQVGDQLVYQVVSGNKEYDFIVTPTKLSASGITFEYKMTEPANKSGIISMSSAALENSMALYNQFSGGPVKLTNQMSVFASKAMMTFAAEGSSDLFLNGPGGESENFVTLDGMDSPNNGSTYIKWIKNINGVDYLLDGPILENAKGSKAIRYTDGGGFPFITFMETDFKIYLKEIIRQK